MAAETGPVFHAYVPPPEAVSVADCPAQIFVLPETETVGVGAMAIDALAEFVHPLAPVTVTE